ncbi:MAG TPA: hypothetical protein VFF81_10545 [Noviherbaspirillum sp.]|nr:hypothetical protein [Noviherbaspirillum sp.]
MQKLSSLILLTVGLACGATSAMATPAPSNEGAKKAAVQKVSAASKKAHTAKGEEPEPDVGGLLPTAYDCELGNKLTIYTDANNDQQIALQWNKRMHRMTRVSTTTGAQRFENPQNGLVWIGIPAKGMLLDSKKGKQLANECKSPEQRAQQVAENG